MKTTKYDQLAKQCSKNMRALHLALDGVVHAEAAGQDYIVRSAVLSAQRCLEQVCACFDGVADEELTAPLLALDAALHTLQNAERVHEIQLGIAEFERLFELKRYGLGEIQAGTGGVLNYTANLRRRSSVALTTSR